MKPIYELIGLLKEEPWSDELPEGWKVIEDGDWTDNHESECKSDIVKHEESGKLFRADFVRTGGYWKGYETELCAVATVEAYQKTITAYREVTDE